MGEPAGSEDPLALLLWAAANVPAWQYVLLLWSLLAIFLYHLLEFHFLEDLLSGFTGHPIQLLYNPGSPLVTRVLPKCYTLKKRFWPTPWLCSPHLQTAFLHFFGRPPQVEYRRQLCHTPDGGTIALDWINPVDGTYSFNVMSSKSQFKEVLGMKNIEVPGQSRRALFNEMIPIVVVIPGLTSDSADAYIKHLVHSIAQKGWRVVVANHRGLGGVSITSNQFYNAGWTEDLRMIIKHIHQAHPKTPLLAVGTSIGANILVKYLGEEREKTPLGGAAAICCPWDLVVCDRFINRRLVQRFYDKILAFGLRSYAQVHQVALSRIADWDLISKSRTVRDFDNYCTRLVGEFETVDTYYRKCSSAYYLDSVAIPLFSISALDDPVCTKEAIPWDECRVNSNVILGVTRHGGHLAFFEGLRACNIWWVPVTTEYLEALTASHLLHKQKNVQVSSLASHVQESIVDQSPYLIISKDGVLATEEVSRKDTGKSNVLVSEDLDEDMGVPSARGQEKLPISNSSLAQNSPHLTSETFKSSDPSVYFKDPNDLRVRSFTSIKTSPDAESKSSSSAGSDVVLEPCHQTLRPSIHDRLESTVSQLLEQVETLKHMLQREKHASTHAIGIHRNAQNTNDYHDWPLVGEVPLSRRLDNEGVESESPHEQERNPCQNTSPRLNCTDQYTRNYEPTVVKNVNTIKAQNRHTLKLLAYVAIVTTWPLVGSALFLYGRKQFKNVAMKYWRK